MKNISFDYKYGLGLV